MAVSSAPIAGSPAGFSLFLGAARWRLLCRVPGVPETCWAFLQRPHITGAYNLAIGVPFTTLFICNHLYELRTPIVWILEAKSRKFFKKT